MKFILPSLLVLLVGAFASDASALEATTHTGIVLPVGEKEQKVLSEKEENPTKKFSTLVKLTRELLGPAEEETLATKSAGL